MRYLCLLGLLAALGCTTSFDLAGLSGRDAASDIGLDVTLIDDVTASTCGTAGRPCCTNSPAPCGPGTICNEGFCATCPGTTVACSGVCVDPQTSLTHCGRCGNACPSGQSCVGGDCTLICPVGLNACGGRCVDLRLNGANCGACGIACEGGRLCQQGACDVSCAQGQVNCNGACVDVQTSVAHCGRCGAACAPSRAVASCTRGACGIASCAPGFADCDADASNGCERAIDTVTDCGRCGAACALANAEAACTAGACQVARCNPGFFDCDGNAANGCEVDINRDAFHCGRCGNRCGATSGVAVCVGGVCGTSSAMCAPNRAECGGSSPTDCETNITTPQNCGRCANTCAIPNATSRCEAGACALNECATGFANCDTGLANGCEVNTASDPANCGGCGVVCAQRANATAACVAGRCRIGACNQGFADCDGNADNGCEADLRSGAQTCGTCGTRCNAPNGTAACVSGQCTIGACNAGFANCDGNLGNGCEVNLRESATSCGTCGNACVLPNARPRCEQGTCRVAACNEGFADCDGNPANGCEVDTRSAAQHCGQCNSACVVPNGAPLCMAGRCRVGSCATGFRDCDGNPANGCETNLNSTANCGGCGQACATGTTCADGRCVSVCPPGQSVCNGACVDLRSSPTNCSACGQVCPSAPNAAPACEDGRCRVVCAAGYGDCDGNPANGCETSLLTSRSHCGQCGRACENRPNAEATCSAGSCTLSCAVGWRNCDGDGNNGCEVDTASDPGNCGGCLQRCPRRDHTLPFCRGGSCGFECLAGWANCDGNPDNGCETDLVNSPLNCGQCLGVCVARECRGGVCTGCLSSRSNFTSCEPVGGIITQERCATNLQSDLSHCGACGIACPSNGARVPHGTMNGTCTAGACGLTCDAGWANCDGAWQSGCETNITCDRDNCGGCNVRGAPTACSDGAVCCNRVCEPRDRPTCNLSAPGCR
ncbi:MAG: hypothetical protein U0325_01115 [Polyangiales bacterium]